MRKTDANIILLILSCSEPIFSAADENAMDVPDQRNAVKTALNSPRYGIIQILYYNFFRCKFRKVFSLNLI